MNQGLDGVLSEMIQRDMKTLLAMPEGEDRRNFGVPIARMENLRRSLESDRKRIDAEPVP